MTLFTLFFRKRETIPILLLSLFLFPPFLLIHGAPDNAGKEFIIGFMENEPFSGNLLDNELFVTTSSDNTVDVTVSAPRAHANGVTLYKTFTVTSGQVKNINIDARLQHKRTEFASKGIIVNASEEVILYSLNKQMFSTDGYLGLPTDVLDTEYVAVSYAPPTMYTLMLVVATGDGSDVNILLPNNNNVKVTFNGRTFRRNEWINVTMNRLDSLQIHTTGDLTGTRVQSTKNLAVFSGNKRTYVGSHDTQDHLVEQLFPVSTWGKSFATVPIPGRTSGDIFRFVSCQGNTRITVHENDHGHVSSYTLHISKAGEFVERQIGSNVYTHVVSDKPMLLVQFVKSMIHKWEPADPSMILVPPIEQYAADYTFTTPRRANGGYINYIMFVVSKFERSGLLLDNKTLPSNTKYNDIPNTVPPLVGGFVRLNEGTYTFRHTSPISLFSAILFGRQFAESYAFPVGLRLAPINKPCTPTPMSSGDGIDNDCDGKIDEERCYPSQTDDDNDKKFNEDCVKSSHVSVSPKRLNKILTTYQDIMTSVQVTTVHVDQTVSTMSSTTEIVTSDWATSGTTDHQGMKNVRNTLSRGVTSMTLKPDDKSRPTFAEVYEDPPVFPAWFRYVEVSIICMVSLIVLGGGICVCKRFCLACDDTSDDDEDDEYIQRRIDLKSKLTKRPRKSF